MILIFTIFFFLMFIVLPVIIEKILINKQNFSKTANIWGINNNSKGTNTNRILLIKKEI